MDSREEDGLMKASRSPATKRDVGRGRQTEPTYCCPTAAEKRKRRVATGEPGWKGEERRGKQAAGGFGRGRGEGGDAAAAAGSRPNPPPHHYWSKDVGKQKEDRELEAAGLDGWRWREGRPKQKRCAGKASKGAEKQAEMATVADEPSHLCLPLTLSFPPPHKQAQQQSLQSTPAPPPSVLQRAPLLTAWCMERKDGEIGSFWFLWLGREGRRECLREARHGLGRHPPMATHG